MTPEHWAKLRTLLEDALELPPDQQSAFLRERIADPVLLAEAERFLSLESEASSLFTISTWHEQAASPAVAAGTAIGNYRIVAELGRGGMGTVYLAERADGAYQGKVAIKVLQENIFTPALADRFTEERQILARLHHPGIARLVDGGVLPDGRPFLALDYVEGLPVDQYCDNHSLDTEARLRLFLRVADAVQSAHQQFVLHLDLKPANILVTAAGEPMLLDFGIARLFSDVEEQERKTGNTLRLLTPRYASPEQATGEPLGVASDVFSLATLLYRLLTGRLPYPIEDAPPLEAVRMLREVAPLKPSEAAPAKLRAGLTGDIDTILLQALRKEPARRYPTVAAFSADVERHLTSQPVSAHADSFGYRAGKFLQRNRAAAIAAAAASVVLIVSAVAVVRATIVARQQRAVAEQQRATAERRFTDVRQLAHSYIFELTPQLQDIPGTLEVRSNITQRAFSYLEAMSREKSPDEALQHELAGGYWTVGLLQGNPSLPSFSDQAAAVASVNKGLAIQRDIAAHHPDDLKERGRVVMMTNSLGDLTKAQGDITTARRIETEAWTTAQPIVAVGPKMPRFFDSIATLWLLATTEIGEDDLWNFADPQTGMAQVSEAEAMMRKFIAANPEQERDARATALFMNILLTKASGLRQLGREAEATATLREAVALEDRQPLMTDAISLRNRRLAHLELAQQMLRANDIAAARSLSGIVRPEAVQEKQEQGPNTRNEIARAEADAWFAVLDLRSGDRAKGLTGVDESLKLFRAIHQRNPTQAGPAAMLARNLLDFAQRPELSTAQSQNMAQEALAIASAYDAAHPEVLSAKLTIGEAETLLASLANRSHQPDETRAHATRAVDALSAVLSQRPGLLAATALLAQVQSLRGR